VRHVRQAFRRGPGGAGGQGRSRQQAARRVHPNSAPEWCWCENEVTYDNGRICKPSCWRAARALGRDETATAGTRSEWLMQVQTNPRRATSASSDAGWFSGAADPPSSTSSHRRRGPAVGVPRRVPLHARREVEARDEKCFNWFLGANDLNTPSTTSRPTVPRRAAQLRVSQHQGPNPPSPGSCPCSGCTWRVAFETPERNEKERREQGCFETLPRRRMTWR